MTVYLASAGGLCWTLARGLHFLLTDLGFDAALMYMDPGHCCVRVELPEGSYYADVGYSAPIFQAYPLFESFSLDTPVERFDYEARGRATGLCCRRPDPVLGRSYATILKALGAACAVSAKMDCGFPGFGSLVVRIFSSLHLRRYRSLQPAPAKPTTVHAKRCGGLLSR